MSKVKSSRRYTPPRARLFPFKMQDGDDTPILAYMIQVWKPSFAKIDALTEWGWVPNPPFAAEAMGLKNTVLFMTGDRDIACGSLPEIDWEAAPNMIEPGSFETIDRPEDTTDEEWLAMCHRFAQEQS